jgi:hypothetical protein
MSGLRYLPEGDDYDKQIIVGLLCILCDLVCGLLVSVPGYRSRDPGFDSRCYQIF